MTEDPYKILGISRDASKEEIKKAYRRKAKQYHPDLHPDDPEAAKMMNKVNEAYATLSNMTKYSQTGQNWQSGTTGQSYSGGSGASRNSSGQKNSGSTGYGQSYSGSTGSSQTGSGQYGTGSAGPGGSGQSDDDQFWHYYRGSEQNTDQSSDWFRGFGFNDIFGSFGGADKNSSVPHPKVEPGDSGVIRQAVDMINLGRHSAAADILNGVGFDQRNARWYFLSALANHGLGNNILAAEQIKHALELEPENRTYQRMQKIVADGQKEYKETNKDFQHYAETAGKFCLGAFGLQFLCMLCWH